MASDAIPANGEVNAQEGPVANPPAGGEAEDLPECAICQQPMRPNNTAEEEVQMLACGHVWHAHCLEGAWRVGGHAPGWCPFRCNVQASAQPPAGPFAPLQAAPAAPIIL